MASEKEWREKDWDMPPLYAELYARNQALEQQLREAEALLYLFSADEAEPLIDRENDAGKEGYFCTLCDTFLPAAYLLTKYAIFPHAPECPWLRARAFLEKED